MLIETLKKELLCIEGEMEHMELQDTVVSCIHKALQNEKNHQENHQKA